MDTITSDRDRRFDALKTEASVTAEEGKNPYHIVRHLIRNAVSSLGMNEDVFDFLKKPLRVLEVSLPVRMDNGQIKNFTGFRSQHLDILGPTKGGVRFHPNVHLDEVKALSMWMSLKSAILGIPYGGAKGGVIVEPRQLSERELEELSRKYIRSITPLIGPEKDIPAPDVNTNPTVMGWMLDEYDTLRGKNVPGSVTGKPLVIGGSQGRLEATGRGVCITIAEAAKRLNLPLKGATAAIQGFGNVGSVTAKFLYQMGVRIIGITDSQGGVYHESGLNIPQLTEFAKETGSVMGFPDAQPLDNETLFRLPVHILVPAALENQVNEERARDIRANIIAEAANGPTTPDADRMLARKETFIIPDILCNAGGVTVSYFEWVQNVMNYYWDEPEVNQKLSEKMTRAFADVFQMTQAKRTDMRSAAYMVAIGRLADALQARGWIKHWQMPIRPLA